MFKEKKEQKQLNFNGVSVLIDKLTRALGPLTDNRFSGFSLKTDSETSFGIEALKKCLINLPENFLEIIVGMNPETKKASVSKEELKSKLSEVDYEENSLEALRGMIAKLKDVTSANSLIKTAKDISERRNQVSEVVSAKLLQGDSDTKIGRLNSYRLASIWIRWIEQTDSFVLLSLDELILLANQINIKIETLNNFIDGIKKKYKTETKDLSILLETLNEAKCILMNAKRQIAFSMKIFLELAEVKAAGDEKQEQAPKSIDGLSILLRLAGSLGFNFSRKGRSEEQGDYASYYSKKLDKVLRTGEKIASGVVRAAEALINKPHEQETSVESEDEEIVDDSVLKSAAECFIYDCGLSVIDIYGELPPSEVFLREIKRGAIKLLAPILRHKNKPAPNNLDAEAKEFFQGAKTKVELLYKLDIFVRAVVNMHTQFHEGWSNFITLGQTKSKRHKLLEKYFVIEERDGKPYDYVAVSWRSEYKNDQFVGLDALIKELKNSKLGSLLRSVKNKAEKRFTELKLEVERRKTEQLEEIVKILQKDAEKFEAKVRNILQAKEKASKGLKEMKEALDEFEQKIAEAEELISDCDTEGVEKKSTRLSTCIESMHEKYSKTIESIKEYIKKRMGKLNQKIKDLTWNLDENAEDKIEGNKKRTSLVKQLKVWRKSGASFKEFAETMTSHLQTELKDCNEELEELKELQKLIGDEQSTNAFEEAKKRASELEAKIEVQQRVAHQISKRFEEMQRSIKLLQNAAKNIGSELKNIGIDAESISGFLQDIEQIRLEVSQPEWNEKQREEAHKKAAMYLAAVRLQSGKEKARKKHSKINRDLKDKNKTAANIYDGSASEFRGLFKFTFLQKFFSLFGFKPRTTTQKLYDEIIQEKPDTVLGDMAKLIYRLGWVGNVTSSTSEKNSSVCRTSSTAKGKKVLQPSNRNLIVVLKVRKKREKSWIGRVVSTFFETAKNLRRRCPKGPAMQMVLHD